MLILYLVFDFVVNLSFLLIIPETVHNKVYPIFTLAESLLFATFFYKILEKPVLKKAVVVIALILTASSLVYYYYVYFLSGTTPWLDSVPIGLETIVMFTFSFFYFYEQLNDQTNLFVYNKASFWFVLGILIYLAGSFFVYISANEIDQSQLAKYWIITNISSILKNVLFSIAIYIHAKHPTSKPPMSKPPNRVQLSSV